MITSTPTTRHLPPFRAPTAWLRLWRCLASGYPFLVRIKRRSRSFDELQGFSASMSAVARRNGRQVREQFSLESVELLEDTSKPAALF